MMRKIALTPEVLVQCVYYRGNKRGKIENIKTLFKSTANGTLRESYYSGGSGLTFLLYSFVISDNVAVIYGNVSRQNIVEILQNAVIFNCMADFRAAYGDIWNFAAKSPEVRRAFVGRLKQHFNRQIFSYSSDIRYIMTRLFSSQLAVYPNFTKVSRNRYKYDLYIREPDTAIREAVMTFVLDVSRAYSADEMWNIVENAEIVFTPYARRA